MKKALLIIGGINLAAIILLPLSGTSSMKDYITGMGVVSFLASMLNLAGGVILLLISLAVREIRPYAASCLIAAGVLLLCGFTLCSAAPAGAGHF